MSPFTFLVLSLLIVPSLHTLAEQGSNVTTDESPEPGQKPGRTCLDFCEQICYASNNRLVCRCVSGFSLNKDGRSCSDVDECIETWPCQQMCINTHGGYHCACHDGYEINADGVSCSDINECDYALTCTTGQNTCINLPGSYLCLPVLSEVEAEGSNNESFGGLITGKVKGLSEDEYPMGMSPKQVVVAIGVLLAIVGILTSVLVVFIVLISRRNRPKAGTTPTAKRSPSLMSVASSGKSTLPKNRLYRKRTDRHYLNYYTIEARSSKSDDFGQPSLSCTDLPSV